MKEKMEYEIKYEKLIEWAKDKDRIFGHKLGVPFISLDYDEEFSAGLDKEELMRFYDINYKTIKKGAPKDDVYIAKINGDIVMKDKIPFLINASFKGTDFPVAKLIADEINLDRYISLLSKQ